MLTLNAADEPIRPDGYTFHYPISAAAANPITVRCSIPVNINAAQSYTPWLRTDRMVTIPITHTIAAGGNPNIIYIFPREPR